MWRICWVEQQTTMIAWKAHPVTSVMLVLVRRPVPPLSAISSHQRVSPRPR